jgi:hypothetical protein
MVGKSSKVAMWYAKFRGSAAFLWGLTGFIVAWLTIHCIISWWDKDLSLINLLLSSEASVSLAFFAMMQEQTEMYHTELMETIKKMVKDISEDVDDIKEEVEETSDANRVEGNAHGN